MTKINDGSDFELLSVNAARSLLRIRHSTLKELIKQGAVGTIKIKGRTKIPVKSLKAYLERQTLSTDHETFDQGRTKLSVNDIISTHIYD